jgi:uncharacterized phiE125 gp8 family phage protein
VTVAEMRLELGLGPEVPDEEVVDLYAASLEEAPAAPVTSLVSLDEVKRHLKLEMDDTAEDLLLESYIEAVIGHLDGPDGWLGRALVQRTYTHRVDHFDFDAVRLPYPPVILIASVKYRDATGVDHTVDPDTYELDGREFRFLTNAVRPTSYYSARPAVIAYRAGYEVLPAPIRIAVLMMVADLYRNRESTAAVTMSKVPMSASVENLLFPFRVFG